MADVRREDQNVLESVEDVEGVDEDPPWEADSHPYLLAQPLRRNCHYCPLKIKKDKNIKLLKVTISKEILYTYYSQKC